MACCSLVGDPLSDGERLALGGGAVRFRREAAGDRGGPGVGGQRILTKVTPYDRHLGASGGELVEDEVGKCAAGGAVALDAGVDAE